MVKNLILASSKPVRYDSEPIRMQLGLFKEYSEQLQRALRELDPAPILRLARDLQAVWRDGNQVFLCGNGGSAANALHIANDLMLGISRPAYRGIKVKPLTDTSILTCLANDLSYEEVFSRQIAVLGTRGDILIVLSGSGNSKNIIKAVTVAKDLGVKTYGILGYGGGACLNLVDVAIHFRVDDMQLAEDLQLVAGHMLMRWLSANPVNPHG